MYTYEDLKEYAEKAKALLGEDRWDELDGEDRAAACWYLWNSYTDDKDKLEELIDDHEYYVFADLTDFTECCRQFLRDLGDIDEDDYPTLGSFVGNALKDHPYSRYIKFDVEDFAIDWNYEVSWDCFNYDDDDESFYGTIIFLT